MGCGRRVASEKCSWNQGLPSFPAIFRPDNPLKLPRAGSLTQGELAARQGKILSPSRFAAFQRPGQSGQRPVQPVAPRRMIAAAQGLHDTAHQPAPEVQGLALDGRTVERDASVLPDLEKCDPGSGGLDLLARPHAICIRFASFDTPCQAQAGPLEARIGIGRIVEPGDTSR